MKAQIEKTPLVQVTIKSAEWATYKDQWKNKQMPVFFLGWYPDYVDPDDYTVALRQTRRAPRAWASISPTRRGTTCSSRSRPRPRTSRAQGDLRKDPDDVDGRGPDGPHLPGQPVRLHKKNVTGVKIGPTLIFIYNQLKFTK